MEIINIGKNEDYKEYVGLISDRIKQGKVVVLPTDTIYGLSCLATDKKAIDKIYEIKKRDKNNPLLVLVGSYCMLKDYFHVSARQEEYLRAIWPSKTSRIGNDLVKRPTSAVLKTRGGFLDKINSGSGFAAVRLPNDKFLAKLVMKIGTPIVSTSLNISGEANIENLNEVSKYFRHRLPDAVVDAEECGGVQRKFKKQKPSKLIDITDIDNIKILRR